MSAIEIALIVKYKRLTKQTGEYIFDEYTRDEGMAMFRVTTSILVMREK